jgi:hypothetical protein
VADRSNQLARGHEQDARSQGVRLDVTNRNTFVFVSASRLARRLDHWIESEEGIKVGSVLEQPRPGRWAGDSNFPRLFRVRLDVYDENGLQLLEIVRAFGLGPRPLSVTDREGVLVGTVRRTGFRRFALRDRFGQRIGSIVRAGYLHGVDFVIKDAAGQEVGSIADFAHIARRSETSSVAGRARAKRWLNLGNPTDEHVLEITGHVTPELRALMLASSAAVYLVLQPPYFEND